MNKLNLQKETLIRLISCWCLLCTILTGYGQKMSIESFEPLEKDLTANSYPTIKEDFNGDKCALIKVQTTQHNFMFDVGSLGIVHQELQNSEHPGEIWLYVPHGVKRISIQHPQFGSINDYDLGRSLKKGKTYLLKLTSDQVNTLVVDYDNSQYLKISVQPADATFMINGIRQQLNAQGVTEIPLPFGTHTYRVTHPNYHPEENQVVINDKENRQELNINLRQAFGYLSVLADSENKDADVWVDDVQIGRIPVEKYPVKSGTHELKIIKKLFSPYTESFAMTDSALVEKRPLLSNDFAEVSLRVDGDKEAGIYDNGIFLGEGSWSGRLGSGVHQLEARKVSHRPVVKEVNIVNGKKESILLEAPVPIYGTLEITTSPSGADVMMDGKTVGRTPLVKNDILVGSHSVELKKAGHRNEVLKVDIEENNPVRKNVTLTDFCNAKITATPAYASLYINGAYQKEGMPHTFNLIAGKYDIKVSAHGYTPYNKTLELNGTTKDIHVTLHRNYIRKNEFYIQAGYNLMAMSGMNFGIGAYISNVNIEANYLLGLSKSPDIYWNKTSNESLTEVATYTPQGWNFKAGYGIRLFNRMRLTPQVGIQNVILKEKLSEFIPEGAAFDGNSYETVDKIANGASAISFTAGLRLNLALAPVLGISVTPEYIIPMSKSAGYKKLSDLSSKIKGYSEGFGCNISINLFF